ncbi:hypothetical protein HHE92_08890 [Pseudoalteromonas arctica]|uniref:Orphan protein n=1 Tax=Pseudoalteromonas arctica TaxID=394751 RepID=A0ABU9TIJ6_9GAMM|nr:hypothetical protein [Pseudoalteromonas arctica]NMP79913.1 hypothetical protein [Pseudoalteromonas arctica]
MVIHKIQSKPSYASLSLVPLTRGKYNECDSAINTTLASKLTACFKNAHSYLETQDFAINNL